MQNGTCRNSVLFLAAAIISVAPAMLAQMGQPQASQAQQNVQQMPPASAPASLCANRPLCYEANDFVVTVSEFRTSTDGYGNKILDAMVHFQNKTNQPISLGYVDGSGSALDDMGNRFALNTGGGGVRGMGVVAGNNMDPKFTLPPHGAGDARFELWWPPRGKLAGVNYEMELSIREMTRIEGNQWTLGDETLIHYQGLANGMGVAPVSGSMVSGGGMGSTGGTVNGFTSPGNVISTSGQPVSVYSTQPCPPAGSTTDTLTNAANAAGSQNQNANSAINNASQAISNLGSLFHKKKAANAATPTATANVTGPCRPATNVSGPSAAPVANPSPATSTATTAPAVSPTLNPKAAVSRRPATVPATTSAVEKAPVTATAQTATSKTSAQKPSAAVVKTSLKQAAPATKTATTPPKKPATTSATTNNPGSSQ